MTRHSWGDAVYEAFDPARRRLCLTGTPFRTNREERIPFVTYRAAGPGEVVSEADYTYGYREAWPTASSGRWSSPRTPGRADG